MAINENISEAKTLAVRRFLLICLQEAIDYLYQKAEIANLPIGSIKITECKLETESLYLYLVKDETQLRHSTSIALNLSKLWQRPTMEIAADIAGKLYHINQKNGGGAAECEIKVVPPGWINLQLNDASIATWLQRFAQQPPWVGQGIRGSGEILIQNLHSLAPAWERAKIQNYQSIFLIQYAHARCCSLLRLAHREKLIELAKPEPDRTPAYFRLVHPTAIPWLTTNQKLRLIHPAEKSLIYHLLSIPDAIYCPLPKQLLSPPWENLATNLSQSLEKFHSQCRIWGEVKREAPELAQARLGLVLATQALLRLILEDLLGLTAPLEL